MQKNLSPDCAPSLALRPYFKKNYQIYTKPVQLRNVDCLADAMQNRQRFYEEHSWLAYLVAEALHM